MLQSPYFLYRTELGTAAAGASKVALNDWEVGAKLALSITNTIPDDTLLAAAAAGQLHDTTGVATQAKRLLDGATGTVGSQQLQPPGVPARRVRRDHPRRDGVPRLQAEHPGGDEAGGAAVPELDLHSKSRDQGLLHDARGVRGLAARAALRRDRQLLERPGHADEGRPRSEPAVRSADAGRVPVVVHLGGRTSRTSSTAACSSRNGCCARRCRRRTPRRSGR